MFFDLLRNRRSIRKFQDRTIEADKLALLKETALRSPSSRSLNPWEFVFVTDPDLLENLSRAKPHGAGLLSGAALGVAVLADPDQCDVWVEDCAIASILLQLAAESLGLKSCWVQIRKRMQTETVSAEEAVKRILAIPDRYRVLSIVAMGYPAEEKAGHDEETLLNDRIHSNLFGQ